MKKLGVLLLLLSVGLCFAQSTVLYNLNNNRLLSNSVNKIGVGGVVDNDDYEGSPFLDQKFLPSKIKGEKETFLLRYNIFNDEIILKNNEEYYRIPKEGVDYFNIDNRFIIRLINGSYYIDSSIEKNNYVVVRKEKVVFTPGKTSENTYDQGRAPKFSSSKPDYFLYNIEKKNINPLKKDELKKLFPNRTRELEEGLKKNKLKSTTDFNDLLNLIAG